MGYSQVQGPDFICIGMIKAGTGWLYDQVRNHPDFWMPPVKEIRYLSRDPVKMEMVEKFADRARSRRMHSRGNRNDPWSDRDMAFLQEAIACKGEPRSFQRYSSLFRFKDEKLSGDISPGYSRLDAEVISLISRHLPKLKIVLL